MLAVAQQPSSALPAPAAALADEVWVLDPPPRHELKWLERDAAGCLLDRLLVRVARGRGALDVALGDGLGALSIGDRVLRLDAAFRAVRAAEGRWLPTDECLVRVAEHFISTWKGAVPERRSPGKRAFQRDGGFCQVPGCSRPATHEHHVVYRSRGGTDDDSNLVSMCAAHHLHGVHAGYVRVSGLAPDGLTWELGVRFDGPPLEIFEPAATVH